MNLKERPQIMINEEELDVVTDITYLGSNNSVENSVQKDISVRINKARNSTVAYVTYGNQTYTT